MFNIGHEQIFLSELTGLILTKLGKKDPYMVLFNILVSNENATPTTMTMSF